MGTIFIADVQLHFLDQGLGLWEGSIKLMIEPSARFGLLKL